jgi:hypothetical protein
MDAPLDMKEPKLLEANCLDCDFHWRSYSEDRLNDYAAFHEAGHHGHMVSVESWTVPSA